ncbi:phosphatidylglycerophosphatase A [Mucilaginibacter robiniae]|uniref:Phosphatidylglycerophosphatase A n=1 Tax=Mucilaginibacter robiniae TaxID=2728022 RepID=A0A7L5E3X5_9SPHI|nr:phosphatidylglycerophosphatase A [Mucilaginibacter robiniae]QJD96394.1 phosphatidylglycerophosphatase A [Mucilaginibacter robiniae]
MNKIIASWFGIGYVKGGGTVAAVVTCLLVYGLAQAHALTASWMLPLITVLITAIGIHTGNQVEPDWGKDSYRVVIDEVAGQLITLLLVAINPLNLVIGLILFRFFDIVKPLYIRKMEALPKGTGVMMDDILAGVYANIVLHLILLAIQHYG